MPVADAGDATGQATGKGQCKGKGNKAAQGAAADQPPAAADAEVHVPSGMTPYRDIIVALPVDARPTIGSTGSH